MKALQHLSLSAKKFGLKAALSIAYDLILNRFQRRDYYLFYHATAETVKTQDQSKFKHVKCREVTREEMLALVPDPDYSIDAQFIEEEYAAGSRAFASFEGSKITGYQFLSKSNNTKNPELQYTFPEGSAYLFRGYVHPKHRGRGTIQALIFAACNGSSAKAFYSCVKSIHYRMGNIFNTIGFFSIGGFVFSGPLGQKRNRLSTDPSIQRAGIRVEFNPSAQQR